MAYHRDPRESPAAGLRRGAVDRAAAAVEHLADSEKPAEAVHEARKRSKEARAALRLLHGALGADSERAARARFRDAARSVSALRAAEVGVEALEELRHRQRLLRREREAAQRVLRERRDAADAEVTPAMRKQVAAAFAAAAEALPSVPLATAPSVAASLARIYRRGKQRMDAAVASDDATGYHAWRKSTKDLWYAVRLFEPAWPGPLGILAGEVHELSQVLGEEHDLTVLRAPLKDAAAPRPPARASGERSRKPPRSASSTTGKAGTARRAERRRTPPQRRPPPAAAS